MAAEAEAAREARAKVIAAEGEQKASFALKEAAEVIQESPSALQVIIFDFSCCCRTVFFVFFFEKTKEFGPKVAWLAAFFISRWDLFLYNCLII